MNASSAGNKTNEKENAEPDVNNEITNPNKSSDDSKEAPNKQLKQSTISAFFAPKIPAGGTATSTPVKPSINSIARDSSKSSANSSSSSFTITDSQKKRVEDRLRVMEKKLLFAWQKRDWKLFNSTAVSAGNLPRSIIDKVDNEVHRFAILKEYNRNTDKEKLKHLNTKEQKEAYRKQVARERRALYRLHDPKIRAHFQEKMFSEDWCLTLKPLAPLGDPISMPTHQLPLFSDCLMITQLPLSLKGIIHYNAKISAEELFCALSGGLDGFTETTSRLLGPFAHFFLEYDRRIFMTNVSNKDLDKAIKSKITVRALSETIHKILSKYHERMGMGKEQPDTSVSLRPTNYHSDNEDADSEGGRSTPGDRYMNMEEEMQLVLAEFSKDTSFFDLAPHVQVRALCLLADLILHHSIFKQYTNREGTRKCTAELNAELKAINEELSTAQTDLTYNTVEDEEDESCMTRAETKKREEKRHKHKKIQARIEELHVMKENVTRELAEERLNLQTAKRIAPIGKDRHMRQYYWFSNDTLDDGIWIQDFGTTAAETYLKSLAQLSQKARKRKREELEANKSGGSKDESSSRDNEPLINLIGSKQPETQLNASLSTSMLDLTVVSIDGKDDASSTGSQTVDSQTLGSQTLTVSQNRGNVEEQCPYDSDLSETWYHILDKTALTQLRDSLLEKGAREGELKTYLKKHFADIIKSMEKFLKRDEEMEEKPSDGATGADSHTKDGTVNGDGANRGRKRTASKSSVMDRQSSGEVVIDDD